MTPSTPNILISFISLSLSLLIVMYSPYSASAGQSTSIAITASGAPTSATFSGGAAVDGGVIAGFSPNYDVSQKLDISISILLDSEQNGKSVQLYTVVSYNNLWFMKSTNGNWLAWDLNPKSLVPSRAALKTFGVETVNVQKQLTGLLGNFVVYVGYQVDNDLYYNATPFRFTVSNDPIKRILLNDTGIGPNQCYQAGSDLLVSCTSPAALSLSKTQDGMLGPDANPATNSNTDGALGFSFIKVCNNGKPAGVEDCPANPIQGRGSTNWGCTFDKRTKYLWEVKTNDGGLHDGKNTYTNYNVAYNPKNQYGTVTDASGFVNSVNAQGLCGLKGWQLPTVYQLRSLVHYGIVADSKHPAIDTVFFPNTSSGSFHTASGLANIISNDWQVIFSGGWLYPRENKNPTNEENSFAHLFETPCERLEDELDIDPAILIVLLVC